MQTNDTEEWLDELGKTYGQRWKNHDRYGNQSVHWSTMRDLIKLARKGLAAEEIQGIIDLNSEGPTPSAWACIIDVLDSIDAEEPK